MSSSIRPFEPEDHAAGWALWESTEGIGLSEGRAFWKGIGAEERTTLALFSLPT